jgi:putative transposase
LISWEVSLIILYSDHYGELEVSMALVLHPWHVLVLVLSARIRREHEKAIEYLRAENQVLRESLDKGRVLLNDSQRGRLAVAGKALGRKALSEIATVVTPDTILRWHRQLVAQTRDYGARRKSVGRPRTKHEVVDLITRMAKANEGWGCDRIQGALQNLGYRVSDTTVGEILKDYGIPPAPERRMSWKKFLKSQWETTGVADCAAVEVWKCWDLVTSRILAAMWLLARHTEIAGVTASPDAAWVEQVGRCLTDGYDGFLLETWRLPLDWDKEFLPLRGMPERMDTTADLPPPRSPDSSSHDHLECDHQGLGHNTIQPDEETGRLDACRIQHRVPLGGRPHHCLREAA